MFTLFDFIWVSHELPLGYSKLEYKGKWGLRPRIIHWIYTLVRPILTCGCLVWWESLDRNTNSKLIQRQRDLPVLPDNFGSLSA